MINTDLRLSWFNKMRSINRLMINLGCLIITFLILLLTHISLVTRIMISWNVFCLSTIIMCWITFFTVKHQQIRQLAKRQDNSRFAVFIMVIISSVISLLGIVALLKNKGDDVISKDFETFIYIMGVSCSWVLLHTIFTLRYAHLYYSDHRTTPDKHAGGLDIPGEPHPDYLDFAYYSFVIGMTFQVSDINITASNLRRLTLLHALLSFLFNTVIVALSINAVLDLKQ